jgi:hypothetical protein
MPTAHWPYLLGQSKEMATVLSLVGMDWNTAAATCDEATADAATNVWFAPRGQCNSGTYLCNMDLFCWMARLNYALCAPVDTAPPREEVVQALGTLTPELICEYNLKSKELGGTTDSLIMICLGFSGHVMAALAAEKYGQLDQALGFAAAIHDVDPVRGGDHKASSHILANCVKGRVFQQRGQTAEAAAAFEAAVAQAETVELPLLAAFALRDLKLLVLDGMGIHKHGDGDGGAAAMMSDHGSRRLGAVLRQLKDPPEMFSPLLEGLDAVALATLPPPDAGYEVDYGAISTATAAEPQYAAAAAHTGVGSSDAGTAAAAAGVLVETAEPLRAELQGLRVMALHSRAASEGVDPVAIEDAMDSETPKDDLIALLIIQEARATSADIIKGPTTTSPDRSSAVAAMELAPPSMDSDGTGLEPMPTSSCGSADGATAAAAAATSLARAELEALSLMKLHKRAVDAGIDVLTTLKGAMEADDPKQAIVALLLEEAESISCD